MGSLTRLIILLTIFAAIALKSNCQFNLPITKHEPTNQFYTTVHIGSAAISPVNLLLDLGTNLTWLNCRELKSLSSLHVVTCQSSTCKSIPGNGCDGRSCLYRQPNPLGKYPAVTGRVVQDRVSTSSTDGGKFLSPVSARNFTFSCADQKNLQGLPPPVAGVLALSPGSSSFTRQVTSALNVIPKFSLCLPSSGTGHFYIAGSNLSIPMTLTPIDGTDSGNYLLLLQSIYIDGTALSLKHNSLYNRAKLSTVVPYTVVLTDIYNVLAQSFTLKAEEMGLSKVPSVAPFKHCFDARTAGNKTTGPNVPVIEMGLPGRAGEVKWALYGANTVVKVKETVMCLAFLDGGKKLEELMVIGTHQLQDYMLDFDFSTTRLAISESLLLHNTSCSTWPAQN